MESFRIHSVRALCNLSPRSSVTRIDYRRRSYLALVSPDSSTIMQDIASRLTPKTLALGEPVFTTGEARFVLILEGAVSYTPPLQVIAPALRTTAPATFHRAVMLTHSALRPPPPRSPPTPPPSPARPASRRRSSSARAASRCGARPPTAPPYPPTGQPVYRGAPHNTTRQTPPPHPR